MKDIVKSFVNAIEKNRLSHLYLLSGKAGAAKTKIVKEIAYEIFKHDNDYKELKQQLDNENHPNFLYISKDGQGIKKEQVLNLQTEFSKTSLVKGKRVYVIEAAETMSLAAANSLLKFLEEPKDEETIGFLMTDDENMVLQTIRSRAQVIRIEDNYEHVFIDLLVKQEIDLPHAYYLSSLTNDLEEALTIYGNPMYQKSVDYYQGLLNWIKDSSLPLPLLMNEVGNYFFEEKRWISFILDMLVTSFLDVIHMHMNQKVRFEFLYDYTMSLITKISVNKAEKMILIIHETIKNLRVPVNIMLALQAFAIKVESVMKS